MITHSGKATGLGRQHPRVTRTEKSRAQRAAFLFTDVARVRRFLHLETEHQALTIFLMTVWGCFSGVGGLS